jgi:NAD(P)H-hydrate epimerase
LRNKYPQLSLQKIPSVSKKQMLEVDQLMMEKYQISLPQMMENAGLNLARLSQHFCRPGARILVCAGSGGNGGGALSAARRLHNWGYKVEICLNSQQLTPVPEQQRLILDQQDISFIHCSSINYKKYALILDGLLGYSVKGEVREPAASLIKDMNASRRKILSLDLPSGMHPDEGLIYEATIRAHATLTLALPKSCFNYPVAHSHVGELYVADISVPVELYKEMGIKIKHKDLFQKSGIVRLV